MSKKARKLLEGMTEWARQFTTTLWKDVNHFTTEFADVYDQIVYEDVCHRFKVDIYLRLLKRDKKAAIPGVFKTKADVLDAVMLKHFDDYEWLKGSGLTDNDKRIKVLSTQRVKDVYNWLTLNFLVTDFSDDELGKIAMLGDESFHLETIKKEAARIDDIQKHNISYLYAIVRDVSIKEEYAAQQTREVSSHHAKKLDQLIQFELESKNKLIHEFDSDMRSRWDCDREFIDLLRDLKDNE